MFLLALVFCTVGLRITSSDVVFVVRLNQPENLVLDGKFELKVVDFGLAALIPATSKPSNAADLIVWDKTQTIHSGVGSQPYSAPEVNTTRCLGVALRWCCPPAQK